MSTALAMAVRAEKVITSESFDGFYESNGLHLFFGAMLLFFTGLFLVALLTIAFDSDFKKRSKFNMVACFLVFLGATMMYFTSVEVGPHLKPEGEALLSETFGSLVRTGEANGALKGDRSVSELDNGHLLVQKSGVLRLILVEDE